VIALSLNPDLDIAQLAAEYARGGKVRIANVLTPDSAEALAACLETETPYKIVTLNGEGLPAQMHSQNIPWHDPGIRSAVERARDRFSYVYKSFPMLAAYERGEHPGHALHAVYEFLNSRPLGPRRRNRAGLTARTYATFLAPAENKITSRAKRL
jgi:hypothetical protein